MAFEVNGTKGSISWNFERMNEIRVQCPDDDSTHDGYTTLLTGPVHPNHAHFNPGQAIGLSYYDLKVIEAYQFLQGIIDD